MKQSEMLDVILRYLYERRNSRVEYSIATILEESGITVDYTELARLANQLRVDGLIDLNVLSQKLKKAPHSGASVALVPDIRIFLICACSLKRNTETMVTLPLEQPQLWRKRRLLVV